MAQPEGALARQLGLGDAVDHLLDKGAVVAGEATISLGGVDLIYLGLNLVLSSVETLRQIGQADLLPPEVGGRPVGPVTSAPPSPAAGSAQSSSVVASLQSSSAGPLDIQRVSEAVRSQLSEPDARPEQGLARLVLTLVELLRRVLEHQALRRMEGGGLDDTEIEHMGVALMELEAKVAELRGVFGLEEADLNVDLGPLGQLL
jgi:hypothetical protein